MPNSRLAEIVRKYEQELLNDWSKEQVSVASQQKIALKEDQLRNECREFLGLFLNAIQTDKTYTAESSEWAAVRDYLSNLSRSRAKQGFTPTETAMFVFGLKRSIMARIRKDIKSLEALAEETWNVTELLDRLGLYTVEVFQKSREEVIMRQQQEMMELSTPVVKLWDGVLALPLIGTLDSARTQIVMESLLQRIVETGSEVAIIDITGVPTVDTLVAQHLLKTVTAARLMGADCIISGIRPQIAQTIVHLGVTLSNVSTKASLADAFLLALQRSGLRVTPAAAHPEPRRE